MRDQDIAPNYYDLDTFKKGEIRQALQRVVNKMQHKESKR